MNTENKTGQARAIGILEVQKLLPTVHKVNTEKGVWTINEMTASKVTEIQKEC